MNRAYQKNFTNLNTQYELFKKFVYNGSELRCVELNNYYIDNNTTNELIVEFLETFHQKPELFMTINGFLYQPHLGIGSGLHQVLDYNISDVKESSFRFEISTTILDNNGDVSNDSDDFFKLEDFDRIDICYFAFVRYQKK